MTLLSQLVDAAVRAQSQTAYQAAFHDVFSEVDRLDAQLSGQRYLGGADPSDADWALFEVLVRFDLVHYGLHKLNRTRIADSPNLHGYLCDLFQQRPVDLRALQRQAYADPHRNPAGTVPRALPDLWAPHDRWRFDASELRAAGTEDAAGRGLDGEFVRGRSGFRDRIEPESGRYHLYLAANCPWCHRVALTHGIKGLHDDVSIAWLHFRRHPEQGWQFRPDVDGFGADEVMGIEFIRELYEREGSAEKSVPVLFDRVEQRIVNNESAEIIRLLDWPGRGPTLTPLDRLREIDAMNAWIYRDINNGAYKAGFSSNQAAYEAAFDRFFAAMDRLDDLLADRRWLLGDDLTEADVRLFPTLFRFDHVYYTRMKLNLRRVRDYAHLSRWVRDFWALDGVVAASDLEQCKQGYFGRHGDELVPVGPDWVFPPG